MALQIFPTEVWELILDYVKDGPDILNVLNTFPELRQEGVQHSKKPKWLFPSIIPVLYEWLLKEDTSNCRQVCKTWRNGIEDFTSEDGCPYTNKRESNVASPRPFNFRISYNFKSLVDFSTVEALVRFDNDMALYNHERRMNPFLMRRACFKDVFIYHDDNPLELDPHHSQFWDVVLDFLKTYGHHIWHLDIDILVDDLRSTSAILNFINSFLEHVPNLKNLRFFMRDYRAIPFYQEVEFSETCLLENVAFTLPKLQSLVMGSTPGICKSLIDHFGKGLGRLSIKVDDWEENYANLFTNLTELDLRRGRYCNVVQSLSSIQAPRLAKLVIDTKFFNPSRQKNLRENIIPILTRFKNLEFLNIWRSGSTGDIPRWFKFGPFLKAGEERITKLPSVKFFEFRLGELCFDTNLLSCFPNVQNLLISYPFKKTSFYIQNREIWEVACPKLQEVVLNTYVYEKKGEEFSARGVIRIFRSHYEHFKSYQKKKCNFEDEDCDVELADVFEKMGIVEEDE